MDPRTWATRTASGPDDQDWIVMNPPFNQAGEFIDKALKLAGRGVAALVRTQFLEGQAR